MPTENLEILNEERNARNPKQHVYWFRTPKSVFDFVKAAGKKPPAEIGFVEASNEDEKICIAAAKGDNATYVKMMIERTLYGFNNQLDEKGAPARAGRRALDRGSDNVELLPGFVFDAWHSKIQSLCITAFTHIHSVNKEEGAAFLSNIEQEIR